MGAGPPEAGALNEGEERPPCTAGAESNFLISAAPHSGQAGIGSLILCMAVKGWLQD